MYVLDESGNPVSEDDFMIWSNWHKDSDNTVARDAVYDVIISTIFLGLDYSHGHGMPQLYETMIFGGENDGIQVRYATRENALKGHAEAVKIITGSVV